MQGSLVGLHHLPCLTVKGLGLCAVVGVALHIPQVAQDQHTGLQADGHLAAAVVLDAVQHMIVAAAGACLERHTAIHGKADGLGCWQGLQYGIACLVGIAAFRHGDRAAPCLDLRQVKAGEQAAIRCKLRVGSGQDLHARIPAAQCFQFRVHAH